MELSQRLKELRTLKGWTQSDLAKYSGVSIDSIKGYEIGKTKNITIENLKKISSAFNLTPNNFYTEFLSTNMSTKNKNSVDQYVDQSQNPVPQSQKQPNTTDLTISQQEQLQDEQIYITSLTSAVGAGESVDIDGIEVFDSDILIPFSKILFKTPPNYAKLRCMRVDGYSMMPMLYPDSWVIAEISSEFQGDGLYIINFSGNFMVKMVQKSPSGALDIISINKDYKSYTIGEDDDTEILIIGKVLRCVI